MRPALLVALATFVLPVVLSADPAPVFSGPDFTGWEFVTPEKNPITAVCHAQPDGTIAADGVPLGYVQSAATWANFRLHLEWRWSGKPGNGGVLVGIGSGPVDRNLWPRCLQIQLKHGRAGDLLPMAGATFAEPLSTAPDAKTPQRDRATIDSEHPPGEWNDCDLVCRDGTCEVTINGVLQNRVTGCDPAAGRVGFQFEGAPFELRNFRVEPLAP